MKKIMMLTTLPRLHNVWAPDDSTVKPTRGASILSVFVGPSSSDSDDSDDSDDGDDSTMQRQTFLAVIHIVLFSSNARGE